MSTEFPLEQALIETVETELIVMQSFCNPQFPCDVGTTVAMRMSRAVVSSLCRLSLSSSESGAPILSDAGRQALGRAHSRLGELSRQFEERLAQMPADSPEQQAWIA